jgi:hypothetical protein
VLRAYGYQPIREETSAYPAWKKLGEVYCPEEFTTEYTTLQEPFYTNQEDSILSLWFFESEIHSGEPPRVAYIF